MAKKLFHLRSEDVDTDCAKPSMVRLKSDFEKIAAPSCVFQDGGVCSLLQMRTACGAAAAIVVDAVCFMPAAKNHGTVIDIHFSSVATFRSAPAFERGELEFIRAGGT